jgi:hypothetical protein
VQLLRAGQGPPPLGEPQEELLLLLQLGEEQQQQHQGQVQLVRGLPQGLQERGERPQQQARPQGQVLPPRRQLVPPCQVQVRWAAQQEGAHPAGV